MKIVINTLRRIVDRYDEKNGLRRKTILTCHSAETRNRYKLPEWRTKEGEPLCSIYKDDRCCGSCELAPTCDNAVNCNCYGFSQSVLGGTIESAYMRKCSPYYKYGRMKEDGTFDWDYYKMNQKREEFIPGKFAIISKYESLEISAEAIDYLEENELMFGTIVDLITENGFIKLNFNDNNSKKDYIVDVSINGLFTVAQDSYEIAKHISKF
ncbi:MAG: hypothetical protein K0R54_774 [Clostridiaceae bacterium]|jgi:hypothetical protein|nr:hypothetical protein [Clostridiaceae bacterium]